LLFAGTGAGDRAVERQSGGVSVVRVKVSAMGERVRVAAVIQRGDEVLMVRERVQTGPGRHDGPEYWTLPGGGIDAGEEPEVAVRREVLEEVGLEVVEAREVARVPYPSGMTTVFRVEVADGEPRLGVDDLGCDCPRMIGLVWVPVPALESRHGGSPVPLLIYCW
jgi:8-oxo-dGTP diphosphatase